MPATDIPESAAGATRVVITHDAKTVAGDANNPHVVALDAASITALGEALAAQNTGALVGLTVSESTPEITVDDVIAAGHVRYEAPVAADLVSIVAALDPAADGLMTIVGQPDVPRKLAVRIVGTMTGNLVLVGVGASGQAVGQTIELVGGTRTVNTTHAYATLTSATLDTVAGAGAGETVGIGVSAALGLPGTHTPAASAFAVYKANADETNEAVGTVDADAGTIVPTTVPDGIVNYDFWFNFTYTPTAEQAAHDHTLSLPEAEE